MKAGLREGGGKSFPRRGRPGKFCRVDREKIAGDAAALEGGGSTPLFLPTVRGRSGVVGAAGSQSCVEPQHSTDRAAAPRAGSSATVVGVSPPVHDVDTTRVAAEGTHAATGVCREAARASEAECAAFRAAAAVIALAGHLTRQKVRDPTRLMHAATRVVSKSWSTMDTATPSTLAPGRGPSKSTRAASTPTPKIRAATPATPAPTQKHPAATGKTLPGTRKAGVPTLQPGALGGEMTDPATGQGFGNETTGNQTPG